MNRVVQAAPCWHHSAALTIATGMDWRDNLVAAPIEQ